MFKRILILLILTLVQFGCGYPSNHGPRYDVLKQKLIIEATLTDSCIPVRLWAFV